MKPVHELTNREVAAEALRLAGALERAGVPREKALAEAERQLGNAPRDQRTRDQQDADDARLEKEVQARGVKQLRTLGFVAVNYSQPRATKQTPGVQDTEFFHPGRGVFLKWEAKSPVGKPSPAQVQYAEWCRACGVPYLCGTDDDLFDWLVARGWAVWDAQDNLVTPVMPVTP